MSQDAQEALRVRGVKLLQEGVAQAEVAELLGVHERQVRRWLKRFRRGGWKALAKRKRGRDSEAQMVLSASQQARLVEAIRSCCPDQLRIPGLLWTRSAVGELIERECGVRLDLSTVGALPAPLGVHAQAAGEAGAGGRPPVRPAAHRRRAPVRAHLGR